MTQLAILVPGQGPLHVFPHQFGRIVQALAKGVDHDGLGGRVAKGDGQISKPALITDSAECAASRGRSPFGFAPPKQHHERLIIEAVPWCEVAFRGRLRKLVPRADELAVIAAKDPIPDCLTKLNGDAAPKLDPELGNTAARVEFIGCDDGVRRTDVDARTAGAAVISRWFVDGQR